MSKITLVSGAEGDWEGVYLDGQFSGLQGHEVPLGDILGILGVGFESIECDDKWLEDEGFPGHLEDVRRNL